MLKKVMLFALSLAAMNVNAAGIEGAFNFKLGEKANQERALSLYNQGHYFEGVYYIEKNPFFEKAVVYQSLDEVIRLIKLNKDFESIPECNKTFATLKSMLIEKYENVADMVVDTSVSYNVSKGKNNVVLTKSNKQDLCNVLVEYTDNTLDPEALYHFVDVKTNVKKSEHSKYIKNF